MSKTNKKKRKQKQEKNVITDASIEQKSNVVCSKKSIKSSISMKISRFIFWIALVGIIGVLTGVFCNNYKSQRDAKKNAAIVQYEKERMYKSKLDLQLEMIETLKNYKSFLLENNPYVTSTTEIDGIIGEYISAVRNDTTYAEIMPEYNYYSFNQEKEFSDYLTELEKIVSKFPSSYGINNSVANELSNDDIQEKIDDTKILQRVWNLEEKCSENLKNINDILEQE